MNPLAGPAAALRGLGLILRHPGLMARSAVPAVVALLLSGLGIWAAVRWHADLVNAIWTEPAAEGFWGTLAYGLWWTFDAILGLASGVLSVVITPWLVMLLGLPLCEPLAAAVDSRLGGQAVSGSLLAEIGSTLATTAAVAAVGLAGAVGFFLLGLLPGVGLITTPFVTLVWTPLFLAFDLFDSPLARRQLRLRAKVDFLIRHWVSAASVGLTATLLVALPGLNLIGLPVAVAMGVIVVRDREQAGALG